MKGRKKSIWADIALSGSLMLAAGYLAIRPQVLDAHKGPHQARSLETITQEAPQQARLVPERWDGIYAIPCLYAPADLPDARTDDLSRDDDITLLARVLYGEARGQSRGFKRDVAHSVLNRSGRRKWWGHTLREVILKPWQYSCFNADDPNRTALLAPHGQAWNDCVEIAQEALLHPDADTSNGATHYYTTSISEPSWAEGRAPVKIVQTGGFETRFYRLER